MIIAQARAKTKKNLYQRLFDNETINKGENKSITIKTSK